MRLHFFLKFILLTLLIPAPTFLFKLQLYANQLINNHAQICPNPATINTQWHINNLYDCKSRSLFIPYQLWSGAKFNGDKSTACMHIVDRTFVVNDGENVTITGPLKWSNPVSSNIETVWLRRTNNSTKVQRFVCHAKGIGRVYDSRRKRYFRPGRCKFPAGFGWRINDPVICDDTKIELTQVNWTQNSELESIEFKWWFRRKSGKWHLDHIYRYAVNAGMTHAWKQ